MDPTKTEKKVPLPAPPFHKERPLPRAERSPDRRYSPYPPPSKDDYSGKYAGSQPLPPIYHRRPSQGLRVNWINKDGVVDKEQYITELFAAMEKHSVWSVHTSTRPQFGPNTSAEYELDPVFKDVGLDMSVYGYLLPLLGHKVAHAADVPNSSAQDTTSDMEKKKAPLPARPFYKEYPVPRAERSPDWRYSPYPPVSKDNNSRKYARSRSHSSIYYQLPSHGLPVTWSFNEDGTVDAEKYITELFAAKDKDSFWSVHTSTRPQFGPSTVDEYVLDPVFKDIGLDMSVYGYLLPLLGHKVASTAEAPSSAGQVGTTTGYRQSDDCSEVPVREVAALKISEN